MSLTVGDHLVQGLREWGVDRVFGYAGDGINGILSAWERAGVHRLRVLRGDTDRLSMITEGVRAKVQGIPPDKGSERKDHTP
jgi:hypothetical protein